MKPPIHQTTRVLALLASGFLGQAVSIGAETIYSENFEDTGVADGGFVAGWRGTSFNFLPSASGYLLNPMEGDNPWLNPVPVEFGATIATLPQGAQALLDTGEEFVEGQVYELTFTQFRRDDMAGLEVTASIGDIDRPLASMTFEAVESAGTPVTRTLKYTATRQDAGQNIFLRLGESGTLENSLQAGIDNIRFSRIAPEKAKPAK
jgi:hypothetical protein